MNPTREPMFSDFDTWYFAYWLSQQPDPVKARVFLHARDRFKYDGYCGFCVEQSFARRVERWEREKDPTFKSWHGLAVLAGLRDPKKVGTLFVEINNLTRRTIAPLRRNKGKWLPLPPKERPMIPAHLVAAVLDMSRRQFFKLHAQVGSEESTLRQLRVNRRVVLYDLNDVLRVAIRRLLSQK